MPPEHVETLIVGGGQAGLTMSHRLTQRGRPHLVVERGRIAERWRSERWDGMHFQSPRWATRLPDFPLPHTDPNDFATAREIADFIAAYAERIAAPVRCDTPVTALRRTASGFRADTPSGSIDAANVVVATGPFQRPLLPAFDLDIFQVHASEYRNPAQLPAGGVLVIGSAASGTQIAEDLMLAGRQVFLSIGPHRRMPRRYRGKDLLWWWDALGIDQIPVEKRNSNLAPPVHSGAYGGRTIDFRCFAAQRMVLLGKALDARDGVVRFAPDLMANLAAGDAAYLALLDAADVHVQAAGLDLPEDPAARVPVPNPPGLDGSIGHLDLRAAGIGSVIWCTGYSLDFGWIDIPVLDERGNPKHRYGVTDVPGLYFLGLAWLSKANSAFLYGVGDDAIRLADHIASRVTRR